MDEEARSRAMGFVEGFNAADAKEISAMALGWQQKAEDAIDGDRMWRLTEGYDRLPEFLRGKIEAAGGEVVMGAEVVRVRWRAERGGRGEKLAEGAEVVCADGRSWRAEKVVVTLPLGVLQAGAVQFEPEVPEVMRTARQLRMGHAVRFTMVFRRRLWPETMSFLMTLESLPRVWWTARPEESHSLTGWVGGPSALELTGLGDDELKGLAVTAVAMALGIGEDEVRTELAGFHTHDWETDRWSRGAYTWVPVGGLEASAAMGVPVADALYFAGEHTDTTGHWGTVHAALRSGLRVAGQVLAGGYAGR